MPAPGSYELAQVNVARPLAPMDSALMAGFAAELEPVNALADDAPGFIWRLQDESGDATSIRVDGDPTLMVNLSVWESVGALRAFAYGNARHRAVMRERKRWFETIKEQCVALWWVPMGVRPTVAGAEASLGLLRENGPTQEAFTFKQPFPAPLQTPR